MIIPVICNEILSRKRTKWPFRKFPEGHAPGPPEVPAFGTHVCTFGAHVRLFNL